MTPVQFSKGHQHNAGKDTNAASAGPAEAKSLWNNARYSNEATGEDDHNNDAKNTEVSQLCLGWADWGQFQRDEQQVPQQEGQLGWPG
jgi:hypothetical protein